MTKRDFTRIICNRCHEGFDIVQEAEYPKDWILNVNVAFTDGRIDEHAVIDVCPRCAVEFLDFINGRTVIGLSNDDTPICRPLGDG